MSKCPIKKADRRLTIVAQKMSMASEAQMDVNESGIMTQPTEVEEGRSKDHLQVFRACHYLPCTDWRPRPRNPWKKECKAAEALRRTKRRLHFKEEKRKTTVLLALYKKHKQLLQVAESIEGDGLLFMSKLMKMLMKKDLDIEEMRKKKEEWAQAQSSELLTFQDSCVVIFGVGLVKLSTEASS